MFAGWAKIHSSLLSSSAKSFLPYAGAGRADARAGRVEDLLLAPQLAVRSVDNGCRRLVRLKWVRIDLDIIRRRVSQPTVVGHRAGYCWKTVVFVLALQEW